MRKTYVKKIAAIEDKKAEIPLNGRGKKNPA